MNKTSAKVFALAGVLSAVVLAGCSDGDDDYYYTYNKTASSSSGKTQVTVTLFGDLEDVSATVSSGEVLSFTLDGYSCTGSGYVWLCQPESSGEDGEDVEAYVVTLSYDNGTWSYTAQAVEQEEAMDETESEYTADVVLWLSDDGEVLFVTADGIACTSCDDGSWIYESDGTTYSLELMQRENSGWTYTISLYIANGITIVLPSNATSDNLATVASAIKEGDYTGITIDMSKMKLTEIKNASDTHGGVFYKCTSLISVILPDCLTKIGGYAFADCSALTSITIPSNVTTIGQGAFFGCSSLSEISIPSSVTTIEEQAFSGCSSLASISIPSGVTSIGEKTFLECSSLASISIPSSVTSIGIKVFYKCSSLTSISIPSGVTTIEKQTFYDCSSLTSISIPSSVTSIGDNAFYNCTALGNVTYGGMVSQFKSLVEDNNFGKNNTCLTSATTITCSDGTYSPSSD